MTRCLFEQMVEKECEMVRKIMFNLKKGKEAYEKALVKIDKISLFF